MKLQSQGAVRTPGVTDGAAPPADREAGMDKGGHPWFLP
jgi:hypothetical protein